MNNHLKDIMKSFYETSRFNKFQKQLQIQKHLEQAQNGPKMPKQNQNYKEAT